MRLLAFLIVSAGLVAAAVESSGCLYQQTMITVAALPLYQIGNSVLGHIIVAAVGLLTILGPFTFYKKFPSTHRRVVYQGNIRMLARSPSGAHCSRWYFTFKGNECSGPAPIDGIYATSGVVINSHRAVTFEGLCSGIASGIVNIELKVDACAAGYPVGDAHTSWNGNSRVIIEEVHPPQP